MRYLSRTDLAKVAQPVLREYWRLPEAQEHPWYVDPVLLAKEVLGLTVRYRHLSEDGELLGLTSYGEAEVFLPDTEFCGPCVLDGKTVLLEYELLYAASGPGRLHLLWRTSAPTIFFIGCTRRTMVTHSLQGVRCRIGIAHCMRGAAAVIPWSGRWMSWPLSF